MTQPSRILWSVFTAAALLSGVAPAFGQSGNWTTKSPMPTARYVLGAGVVNGTLYAVGGSGTGTGACPPTSSYCGALEAYDPSSDTWVEKAPLPTPRQALAVGVVNGTLYAVGGWKSGCSANGTCNTVEAYDPVSDTWTTKAPMPTPRLGLAVAVVNGILYAVGGGGYCSGAGAYCNTLEAYDPVGDTWTAKAPMPAALYFPAAGAANGMLYVVGGYDYSGACGGSGFGAPCNTVRAYDPGSDTWTTKTPMPTARSGHGVGVMNGFLYAVGGSGNACGDCTTVEAYDPVGDTWTTKAPMLTGRWGFGLGIVSSTLYAVGGESYTAPHVGTLATNEAFTDNSTDFSLSPISPMTVSAGGYATSQVTVNSVGGSSPQVILSVSVPPAGVLAPLTTSQVTPPSGGSASSMLTVSVAPFVTPSTFTLTVTGTSGTLTHSATADVTVTATTTSVGNLIGNLLGQGCIDNGGIANALTSKLSAAQSAGSVQAAINTLTALKNQINAQAGKHIATACNIGGVAFNPVTVLLLDVQGLIDSLRVSAIPDPITGYVVDMNGVGVAGATVSIVDASTNIPVATTTTDITGFYFFATMSVLNSGATYTVAVTGLPPGYSSTTPAASQAFPWLGSGLMIGNFVLN